MARYFNVDKNFFMNKGQKRNFEMAFNEENLIKEKISRILPKKK